VDQVCRCADDWPERSGAAARWWLHWHGLSCARDASARGRRPAEVNGALWQRPRARMGKDRRAKRRANSLEISKGKDTLRRGVSSQSFFRCRSDKRQSKRQRAARFRADNVRWAPDSTHVTGRSKQWPDHDSIVKIDPNTLRSRRDCASERSEFGAGTVAVRSAGNSGLIYRGDRIAITRHGSARL
jgi:hypothetical protein